jgi:hypothetical protein
MYVARYSYAGKKYCIDDDSVFNVHSRVRTHAVLVISLYELLGNPIT